jgi:hypothetical protein
VDISGNCQRENVVQSALSSLQETNNAIEDASSHNRTAFSPFGRRTCLPKVIKAIYKIFYFGRNITFLKTSDDRLR